MQGCAFNFYSPALEDIRIKYETDVDDISTVFTIMLVCYCAGALSCEFRDIHNCKKCQTNFENVCIYFKLQP